MNRIIKPTKVNDLCYAVDLNAFFQETDHLKLVEYDSTTLIRTGDKVVYQDRILPIYEAKIINRDSIRNFSNLD